MTELLISLGVIAILRLWNTGWVQATVGRWAKALPKRWQWLPPMALTVLATVVVWLVSEPSPDTLADTLTSGGFAGIFTIGLWHFLKRVIPVLAIDKVKKALARAATFSLVCLLFLPGCSGSKSPISSPTNVQQVLQVAEGCVSVTDAALAVTISALPAGTDPAPWEKRVLKLEEASELLRDSKATIADACKALPIALEVGEAADCAKCVQSTETLIKLACGGST